MSHDIVILYGSQTGTAQYLSEEVARELAKRDYSIGVFEMNEYDVMNLPNEKFVIFITATTGQGETPDNMKHLWKFLLIKELPSDSLAGVKFTVFGLGDSGYAKFNSVARKLYQRLLQLGAKEFHERGLGDDQDEFGYDTEFIPWLEGLFTKLPQYFPNKPATIQNGEKAHIPQFLVEKVESKGEENKTEESTSLSSLKKKYCYNDNVILSKVVVNNVLTADDCVKEVRYIELEMPNENKVAYYPGDVAVLWPRNDPEVCKKLAERLGYNYDQKIKIKLNPESKNKKNPFPTMPISVQELLEYWLNVMMPPTRYFFRVLSYFTEDVLHRGKLQEFGSNSQDGKIEYNAYCTKEKRNVYEILFDFHTVALPLNYLLEAVTLQKTREYSISTSQNQNSQRIGLTIAMTEYFTPLKRKITGICSRWFVNAPFGEVVPLWIRKGTLPYPNDIKAPVICVGPGTGVAPHLAFLEERSIVLDNDKIDTVNTYLIFGNRNIAKDFIHQNKLEGWVSDRKMNLLTAFSRDQEQKIYVYHKIKEHRKELNSFILQNKDSIRIFVCGNSKNMPKWVEETFIEILADELGADKAKEFIQQMQTEKRYVVEAW